MTYEIKYSEWGRYIHEHSEKLNPLDFLECEDEDDLKSELINYMFNANDCDFNCSDYEFGADFDKFVEQWKKLKSENV